MDAEGEAEDARHEHAVSHVEGEKERWANVALRHTTLRPGEALSGIVYIPRDEKAHLVWLQIDLGGLRFPFCFEQTLTQVRL